jgi:hypothetical protein
LLQTLEHQAKNGGSEAIKELENARRQAMGLLRLRRHKIVLRALLNDTTTHPEGMTEGEHALYDRVHGLTEKEEERLAGLLLPKNNGITPSVLPKKVKILKDVPGYRGADGINYGPFMTGEEVELPEAESTWMLKGGMAGEIGPNGQNVMYVTKKIKMIKVQADMDVPEYSNPEGHSFGPLKKGEEGVFPEDEARFLERGKLVHEMRE